MNFNDVELNYNWLNEAEKITKIISVENAVAGDGLLHTNRATEHHHMLLLGHGIKGPLAGLLGHLHDRCEAYGGPGCGNIGVNLALAGLQNSSNRVGLTVNHIGGVGEGGCSVDWGSVVSKHVEFPKSKYDVFNLLMSYSFGLEKNLCEIAAETLVLAGFDSVVRVEFGNSTRTIIEKKSGISFRLKEFPEWVTSKTTFLDSKIFIIDGVVESASDIEHILYKAYESKVPLVICAAGFSDEVLETLRLNFEYGTLNVIPVSIPTDIDTVNVIGDIACACDSEVVSVLYGDMISLKSYEKLSTVDRIVFDPFYKTMQIDHPKALSKIKRRRIEILEQREEMKQSGLHEFAESRLKSLEDCSVVVYIPTNTPSNMDSMKSKLLSLFLVARSMLSWGVVNSKRLEEVNGIGKNASFLPEWIPAHSLVIALKLADDFVGVIERSGVLVRAS